MQRTLPYAYLFNPTIIILLFTVMLLHKCIALADKYQLLSAKIKPGIRSVRLKVQRLTCNNRNRWNNFKWKPFFRNGPALRTNSLAYELQVFLFWIQPAWSDQVRVMLIYRNKSIIVASRLYWGFEFWMFTFLIIALCPSVQRAFPRR